MDKMIAPDSELHSLRREITSLQSELAMVRMRMLLNSLMLDFGLVLTAVCVVFFLAMKFG